MYVHVRVTSTFRFNIRVHAEFFGDRGGEVCGAVCVRVQHTHVTMHAI